MKYNEMLRYIFETDSRENKLPESIAKRIIRRILDLFG